MIHWKILSFNDLTSMFLHQEEKLSWNCPFVFPFWLEGWHTYFGQHVEPKLTAFYEGERLLGIAPLMKDRETLLFLGHESVCDYQEMIVVDGAQQRFYKAFLLYLEKEQVKELQLGALPQGETLRYVAEFAERKGWCFHREAAGNLWRIDLPESWEDYLLMLSSKQRHEVRRKIRRLDEYGGNEFSINHDGGERGKIFEEFLQMFVDGDKEKEDFLHQKMRAFFTHVAKELSSADLLRMGRLKLDGGNVAGIFCFTSDSEFFLYNNGYYTKYSAFSVGSLSKLFSIRYAIEQGLKYYNFLKGDERYKEQLGAIAEPLWRITLRPIDTC